MSSVRSRQVAALEKKLRPLIQPRENAKLREAREKNSEADQAASYLAYIAFLVRNGAPKIDEPLVEACHRVEKSEEWHELCEMFPNAFEPTEYMFPPSRGLTHYAWATRRGLIWFFPGESEKDTLSRALGTAPPWLIWFTFADHGIRTLGLPLPDLSSVTCFQRYRRSEFGYQIPKGVFEQIYWPNGEIAEPIPRPRLVDTTWPVLPPKEFIDLTEKEVLDYLHAPDMGEALLEILQEKYPDREWRRSGD